LKRCNGGCSSICIEIFNRLACVLAYVSRKLPKNLYLNESVVEALEEEANQSEYVEKLVRDDKDIDSDE